MHLIQRKEQGTTLVEMLVASALGLFLISGALIAYAKTRAIEQHADAQLQLHESASFALDSIGHDIRMAGFWGLHSSADQLVVDTSPQIFCRGKDISNWALQLKLPIEFGSSLPPCAAIAGTGKTLTTRHATANQQPYDPRYVQVFTDHRWGYLHSDNMPDSTGLNRPGNFNLVINSYYLNGDTVTGIPELRRWSLGSYRKMQNELVMSNISELQIQWGSEDNGRWFWHSHQPAQARLAKVDITAATTVGNRRLEYTASRIFRLQNLQSSDTTRTVPKTP